MAMTEFEPLIEMRHCVELTVNPRNARTHPRSQIEQLAASIREFGFTNPLLIDDQGMILTGHARFQAAKLIGLSRIPTITLSHMSPVQRRAYAIADNKLALSSGWDREILAQELTELGNLDFDLPTIGFSVTEVDMLIDEQIEADPDTHEQPGDAVPSLPVAPQTRLGDIWELGRHRLICGDARKDDTIEALCAGESIDLIFTDPPYNVPIQGHVSGRGKVRHREFAMASGEMTPSQFRQFLQASFQPAVRRCRDGAIAFICMDWRHIDELLVAGSKVFDELKNVCVWNKKNAGMGTFYRSKHELIFVFKVGTAQHVNNFGLGDGGRYRTNVWDYAGPASITREGQRMLEMHPTVKPVALIADAIRDCSRRGDVVADMFAGSGSTLIAAQKCGRSARLCEIDPHYCDVIIQRFEDFTGKQANRVRV
jgi:DNA modification methylase